MLLQAALTGLAHRHCHAEESHGPAGHGDHGVPHAHVDLFGDECEHEHDDCDSDHGGFVIHVSADEAPPPSPQLAMDSPLPVPFPISDGSGLTPSAPAPPVRTAHPPDDCPLYLHVCALRC